MTEPKKVWWVEDGEYSDYRVLGVFSTCENAIRYKQAFGGSIVEVPLDEGMDLLDQGLLPRQVWMYRDGDTGRILPGDSRDPRETRVVFSKSYTNYSGTQWASCIQVSGWFKSDEHLVKVANEKRAQLLASGEWKPDPPNAVKFKDSH